MENAEKVIFEIDGEGIECLQSFDPLTKTITVEYRIEEFEEPISEKLLMHMKSECSPFVLNFKTNAGVAVHSMYVKNGWFKGVKLSRLKMNRSAW